MRTWDPFWTNIHSQIQGEKFGHPCFRFTVIMYVTEYNFQDITHTDPCPEGVGGVATTALVKLLAAAVGNHVFMQSSVPVIVTHHSTTMPLVHTDRRE